MTNRRHIAIFLVFALSLSACVTQRPARLTVEEPPSPRELDAGERIADKRCSGRWSLLE